MSCLKKKKKQQPMTYSISYFVIAYKKPIKTSDKQWEISLPSVYQQHWKKLSLVEKIHKLLSKLTSPSIKFTSIKKHPLVLHSILMRILERFKKPNLSLGSKDYCKTLKQQYYSAFFLFVACHINYPDQYLGLAHQGRSRKVDILMKFGNWKHSQAH